MTIITVYFMLLAAYLEIASCVVVLHFVCIVTVNVLFLFLTVPWVGMHFVIVVFPDHRMLCFL